MVRGRLEDWAASVLPPAGTDPSDLGKKLYQGSQRGIIDCMKLDLARLREAGAHDDHAFVDAAKITKLLEFAVTWQRPQFPVKGRDLIVLGMEPGKEMGEKLNALELKWIERGFSLDKKTLLAGLEAI